MADIQYDTEGRRFAYRVAGVVVRDGRALISRWEGDEELWCLPGGRVEFGEGAEEALAREMREELGCEVQIGRLLWIIDNHFEHNARVNHALELYYSIDLPAGRKQASGEPFTSTETDGSLLFFEWLPLEQLAESGLKPECLVELLRELPEVPTYVLHRDVDKQLP